MSNSTPSVHPRKLHIVQAAVSCFLKRGYHQTGVRDIAAEAGISLGNLYNHFKGKDAVLSYIADIEGEELAPFVNMLCAPDEPLETMNRFIGAYLDYAKRPENALLGVEIMTEALRTPEIATAFGRNRAQLIAALVQCLKAGAKTGGFTPFDDPDEIAGTLLDAIEGHGLRALLAAKPRKAASKRSVQDFLMRGLRT